MRAAGAPLSPHTIRGPGLGLAAASAHCLSAPELRRQSAAHARSFSGGHDRPPQGPPESEYGGFNPPQPPRSHVLLGKLLMAFMWFWMFYHMKKNGAYLLGFKDRFAEHAAHDHKDEDDAAAEHPSATVAGPPSSQIAAKH